MQVDNSWDKLYRDRAQNVEYIERKLNVTDRWHRLIMHMVDQAKLDLSQMKVLEVGCGIGGFCGQLSKISLEATGVDITPEGLRLAQAFSKRYCWNLRLVVTSGCRLPFKTATFDATVSTETLEHIPNFSWAFDEIIRVTKPKGYIIITVPNYLNITNRDFIFELKKSLKRAKSQPDDENLFTTRTLSELMETRRLKPIIMRGIGLVELPSKRGIALRIQRHYIDYPVSVLRALSLNIGFIAQKV